MAGSRPWQTFRFRLLYLLHPRLAVLPLAWLWWRLIDHLRIEWSVNPQYGYGWAVPFLCLYLLWHRRAWLKKARTDRSPGFGGRELERKPEIRSSASLDLQHVRPAEAGASNQLWPSFSTRNVLMVLLALAWLPTRLLEEANPEWRLVSWALAVEVIGLTLLVAGGVVPGLRCRSLLFPLCFFLAAVPWPTLVEGPLIQTLSRTNAYSAVELLDLAGVPAMGHGSIIEVNAGAVGLDEACSGIRSLQAALMISLFFGEFYSLRFLRRAGLCLLGFALSFVFNLARTTLLAWLLSSKGVTAVASWHDPAGVTLLVLCFCCIWVLARASKACHRSLQAGERKQQIGTKNQQSPPYRARERCYTGWSALFIWLLIAEVATQSWYCAHEWDLPVPVSWSVGLPRYNPTFRENRFSETAEQLLRFNQGLAGSWETAEGAHCQGIFLQWNPGRTAAHLASVHTPDKCLTAAGRQCLEQSELRPVWVQGLRLCFRLYRFRDPTGPVYVFHTLWQDRDDFQRFEPSDSRVATRFDAALSGRRNCGQRSLELAIWGVESRAQAETVLISELSRLITH